MILETERLILRELAQADYPDLCEILQDAETMYAYEHAFSDEEVREWLDRQQWSCRHDGVGLWAVIRKSDGAFVGQAGLTMQSWGDDSRHPEIGYLLKRRYWHHGYATEAAAGCKRYAFETLRYPEVCSIIRDSNIASQNVARRIGLTPHLTFVKHYYNIDMPHIVFLAANPAMKS